jgi:hypothetical protein
VRRQYLPIDANQHKKVQKRSKITRKIFSSQPNKKCEDHRKLEEPTTILEPETVFVQHYFQTA